MKNADRLSREIDEIIEALRVNLATNLEALAKRSDALADLALHDAAALAPAMRATAVVYMYSNVQGKVEAAMRSPEQIEAILEVMEDDTDKRGDP